MKAGIIGLGYVGLITAINLRAIGIDVTGIDVDAKKIELLKEKKSYIYEPGTDNLLERYNLPASTDVKAIADADLVLITVGTPSNDDGSQNLTYFISAVKSLQDINYKGAVVPRSTILPGTTDSYVTPYFEHVGYNPEFLAEGRANEDFIHPDKIVIGYKDEYTKDIMKKLYEGIKAPIIETDIKTAEMIKYANNAFLASKISIANELGNITKKLNIDVYKVTDAIGLDSRIGKKFLNAGIGWGGSCFKKDISALVQISRIHGYEPEIFNAVLKQNDLQPLKIIDILRARTEIKGKNIGLLGLSFKPETDDIRDAPSIKIASALLDEGAIIHAYDPRAMNNFKNYDDKFKNIDYCENAKQCVERSDAVLILTEWNAFKDDRLYPADKIIIEGRRIRGKEGVCW